MKKSWLKPFIWSIFLTLNVSLSSWAGETKNDSKSLVVVKARLMEIPSQFPQNNLYNYVYIFKYKVLQVVQGQLKAQEILVGQYNPLQPRDQVHDKMDAVVNGNLKSFQTGQMHELKLSPHLQQYWDGALEDEYFDDDSERWYAVETNLLP